MKKILLMLLVAASYLNAYDNKPLCEKIEASAKSAALIYDKLGDADNAYLLLSNFSSSITGASRYRVDCISKEMQSKYLKQYIGYLAHSKQNIRSKIRSLQRLEKDFPENLNITRYLGDAYKKEYYDNNKPPMREKAIESYKKYITLAEAASVSVDPKIKDFLKSGGLKKVNKTWGDYLNPKGDIPVGNFKAFYLDSREPKKIIFSEMVDEIGVNYPYEAFHGIDSGHFGGYWVGYLEVNKETKKTLYLSFSNSKIRVIVDGYELYKGSHSTEIPYTFKKGKHKVEVEYLNGWHTTELNVKILPRIVFKTNDEIKKSIKAVNIKNMELWYTGVYESNKKDSQIVLNIKKSSKPIVLLLQSYSAVRWKINNPHQTEIIKVILNSRSPIATVDGIEHDKIIYTKATVDSGYSIKRNCSCINGMYHCEGGNFNGQGNIASLFGKKVRGFSGKYSASEFAVPEMIMSNEVYKKIQDRRDAEATGRKQCSKNSHMDTDELFKGK